MDWNLLGLVYEVASAIVGVVGGVVIFFAAWAFATQQWGLGAFLFGWFPSGILAFIGGILSALLWPLLAIPATLYVLWKLFGMVRQVRLVWRSPIDGAEIDPSQIPAFFANTPPEAKRQWKFIGWCALGLLIAITSYVLLLSAKNGLSG